MALMVLIVAGTIVGVVFGIRRGGDPDPSPSPYPRGYNPYSIDEATLVSKHGKLEGVLELKPESDKAFRDQIRLTGKAFGNKASKHKKKSFKVDPLTIATGENNKAIERVHFKFA